jgi:hypothetical protein
VLFINAYGHAAKPTVIFPLKTLSPLSDDVKSAFNIAGSESGWITGAILKTVIEKLFIEELNE